MATNTLLTPDQIIREALMEVHNNLAFTRKIKKQYSNQFGKAGGKIGSTLRIRNPIEFQVRSGNTATPQDVTQTSELLTVATLEGVDMQFDDEELTLDIELFSENYIRPAAKKLASHIDATLLGMYKDVYSQVGSPGTDPATMLPYLQAGQKLNEKAVPVDDWCAVINPAAQVSTVNGLQGNFNNQNEVGKQYIKGTMGKMAGFDFYMSQNINTHTTGTFTTGSTPLVAGAAQTGSSLATDGWAVSTAIFKKGDVFTLAGVFAVNPETKVQLSSLQQFSVTADTSSDGAGLATIPISPEIITSAVLARQTVSNSPADNAVITPEGTEATLYPMNMIFHPEAFTIATASLPMPSDVSFKAQKEYNGINLRILRQYNALTNLTTTRLDVLYGYLTVRPSFACRLIGK